ncbi:MULTISPECIES: hypothetical protein [unclassified Modestobacter]
MTAVLLARSVPQGRGNGQQCDRQHDPARENQQQHEWHCAPDHHRSCAEFVTEAVQMPSAPPYVDKRPVEERLALMRSVFVPREAWVVSGSMLGWGESIVAECDAAVFLTLDPDERLRRLEAREAARRAGGAFDEAAWTAFPEWARGYDDPEFQGRSRLAHEARLAGLRQPVLRLDSARTRENLRDAVLDWEPLA